MIWVFLIGARCVEYDFDVTVVDNESSRYEELSAWLWMVPLIGWRCDKNRILNAFALMNFYWFWDTIHFLVCGGIRAANVSDVQRETDTQRTADGPVASDLAIARKGAAAFWNSTGTGGNTKSEAGRKI